VPRTAKPFFIPVVHSLLRAVGHMVAPELLSQKAIAPSHRTRGSIRTHLIKEERTGAEGHMVAPELTSTRRRGPEPQDTWWRGSPPLHGGVVRRYNLRGNAWMHVLPFVLT
jgi:hypothetical protein